MPEFLLSLLHYLSNGELSISPTAGVSAKGLVALVLGVGLALRIARGSSIGLGTVSGKVFSFIRSLNKKRKKLPDP
jgi:hypothetical protein